MFQREQSKMGLGVRLCPQAGMTLIEMIMAVVILLVLSGLVTNMVISGRAAQDYADRLRRVTEVAQEILDDIQGELREVVRIFGDDALGQAYTAKIQAWPQAVPIQSAKLPVLSLGATMKKDVAGAEITGNTLLFARHGWADTFTCTSTNTYRVDVYRIIGYYPKVESGGPNPSVPWGLNLCKWTSEPLVSGTQIDAITDPTDQAEVLLHLRNSSPDDAGATHASANVVWMLGADPAVAGTFRQTQTTGSLTDAPNTWTIGRADNMSSSNMLAYRHYSVASNYSQANMGVSRFGIRNDLAGSGVGFPHGFEIQTVGPAAARKILLHLVLVTTNMAGLKAYFDAQVVLSVREG